MQLVVLELIQLYKSKEKNVGLSIPILLKKYRNVGFYVRKFK